MATVLQRAVILHMCRSGLALSYLQNNPPTADGALSKTWPIQSVKDKDTAFNAITKILFLRTYIFVSTFYLYIMSTTHTRPELRQFYCKELRVESYRRCPLLWSCDLKPHRIVLKGSKNR